MESKEITINTSDDRLQLSAEIYEVENPKAIIQIVHGALEYKIKYKKLCEFLQKNGYAVFISDNRAHGYSTNHTYQLGFMEDYNEIVEDQKEVAEYIKEKYPNKELILIGHSFGSMIARVFIQDYDYLLDKLILTGSPNYQPISKLGIKLFNNFIDDKNPYNISPLLSRIAKLNTVYFHNKNSSTRNTSGHQDPYIIKEYPVSSYLELFKANYDMGQIKRYKCRNPDLKICSFIGIKDQFVGKNKGLDHTLKQLVNAGYRHVENHQFEEMGHDVLTKRDNEAVLSNLLTFLKK